MSELKHTPLYEEHVALQAKLVPFAGFEMPVQYPTGIRAEHEAVRTAAGMFDVSHMGEFLVTGPGALEFVSYVTTNDPARLGDGQAQYSMFCRDDGSAVDDLISHRSLPGSMCDSRMRATTSGSSRCRAREHRKSWLPCARRSSIRSDFTSLRPEQSPECPV